MINYRTFNRWIFLAPLVPLPGQPPLRFRAEPPVGIPCTRVSFQNAAFGGGRQRRTFPEPKFGQYPLNGRPGRYRATKVRDKTFARNFGRDPQRTYHGHGPKTVQNGSTTQRTESSPVVVDRSLYRLRDLETGYETSARCLSQHHGPGVGTTGFIIFLDFKSSTAIRRRLGCEQKVNK